MKTLKPNCLLFPASYKMTLPVNVPIPDTFLWSLLNIVDNLSSLWCVVVKPVSHALLAYRTNLISIASCNVPFFH